MVNKTKQTRDLVSVQLRVQNCFFEGFVESLCPLRKLLLISLVANRIKKPAKKNRLSYDQHTKLLF